MGSLKMKKKYKLLAEIVDHALTIAIVGVLLVILWKGCAV
jgi:hypothetical protein